jgi:hypothetical protein
MRFSGKRHRKAPGVKHAFLEIAWLWFPFAALHALNFDLTVIQWWHVPSFFGIVGLYLVGAVKILCINR